MKTSMGTLFLVLMPALLLAASPDELKLPDFRNLEERASQSVNLSLDPGMLHLAGAFINAGGDADFADAVRIIRGIRSIQIRRFEFDKVSEYPAEEVETVRHQLVGPGWNRLLQTRSANEKVDIYLLSEDQQPRGFALISSGPREFTVINIVGTLRIEDLSKLQRRLNLSRLRAAAGVL